MVAVAGLDARARGCCAARPSSAPRARCRRGRARWAWAGRWCRSSRRPTAGGRRAATRAAASRRPRPASAKSCSARARRGERAGIGRVVAVAQQHDVAHARQLGEQLAQHRQAVVRDAAVDVAVARRSAPWARSGGSGRAPPAAPCRASRPTRPRRGSPRRGRRRWSAACSAGRRRRGRRAARPCRAAPRRARRPGGAARASRAAAARRARAGARSGTRWPGGRPRAPRRRGGTPAARS